MGNKYLTPEQEAEFMRQLSQGGALDESALTPEEQQQAVQEGAQMAAEDAASGQMPVADAPAAAEPTPEVNADAQLLQSLGCLPSFPLLKQWQHSWKRTNRSEITKYTISRPAARF